MRWAADAQPRIDVLRAVPQSSSWQETLSTTSRPTVAQLREAGVDWRATASCRPRAPVTQTRRDRARATVTSPPMTIGCKPRSRPWGTCCGGIARCQGRSSVRHSRRRYRRHVRACGAVVGLARHRDGIAKSHGLPLDRCARTDAPCRARWRPRAEIRGGVRERRRSRPRLNRGALRPRAR
jgi:hypothetical protein